MSLDSYWIDYAFVYAYDHSDATSAVMGPISTHPPPIPPPNLRPGNLRPGVVWGAFGRFGGTKKAYLYNINYKEKIVENFDSPDELKDKCEGFNKVPHILPSVSRIIAIGDLHGDLKLTIECLLLAKVITFNRDVLAPGRGGRLRDAAARVCARERGRTAGSAA